MFGTTAVVNYTPLCRSWLSTLVEDLMGHPAYTFIPYKTEIYLTFSNKTGFIPKTGQGVTYMSDTCNGVGLLEIVLQLIDAGRIVLSNIIT